MRYGTVARLPWASTPGWVAARIGRVWGLEDLGRDGLGYERPRPGGRPEVEAISARCIVAWRLRGGMVMGVTTPRSRFIAILAAAVIGLAACSGSPGASPAGSVIRVLGSWEGPEIDAFRAAVQPFEEQTGYSVVVSTTRDLRGALERSIEAGDPPDLAGLPGPGYLLELVRRGQIVNLADVIDTGTYLAETAPGFVDIGTVEGKLAGVFMKATVKGLFWYNPDVIDPGKPETWDDLQHDARSGHGGIDPWCVGLASDAASGWPGTDWVEDFVLRQSGPQVYDDWVAGRIRWSSPEIRRAFRSYGNVVDDADVAGGVDGALRTHFSRAGDGLFTDPPQCLFAHQASFMSTFLDESVARHGGRYDFIPFPDIEPRYAGALIGAGDLFALSRDTPGGRDLIRYLVGPQAQQLLVQHGGALSGNLRVTDYPNDLARRQAALLTSATILRFDASDSMPDVMNEAFWQAILDFTADQSQLDRILAQLDAVQAVAYGQD
jgi:alpha-glucoside transport system substrate-binding protein